MKLTSTEFANNGTIPAKYTCDGEDVNPPLTIAGVPASAKSLVFIANDPDVPKSIREDGTWDHWVVFNISPDTTEIAEGHEPDGVHGMGTGGNTDYHGPCPPDGEHRYFFKLYALDTMLGLDEGASKAAVEQAMAGHVLAGAVLMSRYAR
ncbi:MAG: YbhB/YbcL family Raf kinase inhibitor-like protein [bacterium]